MCYYGGKHLQCLGLVVTLLAVALCCPLLVSGSRMPHPIGDDGIALTVETPESAPSAIMVSLEFGKETIFSGNGVLSRMHANALARVGYTVYVICGYPTSEFTPKQQDAMPGTVSILSYSVVDEEVEPKVEKETSSESGESSEGSSTGRVMLLRVPVPLEKWKRLDIHGAWEAFADGALDMVRSLEEEPESLNGELWARAVLEADRLYYVDWTGALVVDKLLSRYNDGTPGQLRTDPQQDAAVPILSAFARGKLSHIPRVYLNFRVFASSVLLEAPTNKDAPKESLFYREAETRAMQLATCRSIALSAEDARTLTQNEEQEIEAQKSKPQPALTSPAISIVDVLLPALRNSVLRLALQSVVSGDLTDDMGTAAEEGTEQQQEAQHWKKGRRYITCLVRLVPDKNAMFFVDLMNELSPFLRANGLVPLLCGAAADKEYAAEVKAKLKAVHPESVIIDTFLSPEEMAPYLRQTVLNVHPCLYEPFGMTIVEAAAYGVPTLLHATPADHGIACGGAGLHCWESPIGASALLSLSDDEAIPMTLPSPPPPSSSTDLQRAEYSEKLQGIVERVKTLLESAQEGTDLGSLQRVGLKSREKALSWSEDDAVQRLLELVRHCHY